MISSPFLIKSKVSLTNFEDDGSKADDELVTVVEVDVDCVVAVDDTLPCAGIADVLLEEVDECEDFMMATYYLGYL